MLDNDAIDAIVQNPNLVVRNLQVTLGYYRLSEGMRRFMGSKNVSWCSFATHASKTAGHAIRHDNMPRLVKSAMLRLAGHDDTYAFLHGVLGDAEVALAPGDHNRLAEAVRRVSLLVSAGNTLVFEELARPFSDLIRTFSRTWEPQPRRLQAFLQKQFQPGPLAEGGQDFLIEAFTAYYNARFTTNAKRKAEYVLQANLLIGLHEQTRLQPHIEQALAVPYDVFVEGRPMEEPQPGTSGPARAPGGRYRQLVTWSVTRTLMSITLPNRVLQLRENVIAPSDVVRFPEDLLVVEDPRCQALVTHFDAQEDTLTGSAAGNWVSLKDRMSFVVDFFRSYQQYKRMFEAPFTPEQIVAIDAGVLPAGKL